MNPLFSMAVLALGLVCAAAQAQQSSPVAATAYKAGLSTLTVLDDRNDRPLDGLIWYPTKATGPTRIDFESAVWDGSDVIRDADAAPGPFPFIVVSHGMFGNARNQAWFGAAMARRGFVVAAVDHPGTSTWLRDPDQRRALWERPRDIARVIDFAVSPDTLPVRIDPDQIFMAGHSLGGFTAMALAGARYDADRIGRFCDATPLELVCGIFADWDIAQTPEDRDRMQDDLADKRIRAFAVFDLGGTQSFSDESLNRIDRPLLVFGAPIMNSGLTLDIEARALVAALPPKTVRYIEPATLTHFDFFNLCTPEGYGILAKELPGDEVVCQDGGAHRAAMHDLILNEVTAFFTQHLL
ncbi:alpha/beta hydrolase family protein [Antarctobacter sp.]|uniref:alpha/beta hydrolase family protein n=1 Tax=Antarctobacter sp. TaxID=1872577 RepID=UPI002B27814A|nr:alpha/beta fold hydrolase [Antarctobacter sp.]